MLHWQTFLYNVPLKIIDLVRLQSFPKNYFLAPDTHTNVPVRIRR